MNTNRKTLEILRHRGFFCLALVAFHAAAQSSTLPVITAPPQSVAVTTGSAITFSVSATGNPPPSYQWRFNGVSIVGAQKDRFEIAFADLNTEGEYDVVVSNANGSVTSTEATLTVTDAVRTGTVLTFDPGLELSPVPRRYGDRVTSWIDASGQRYAAGSGGTSNVTVEYGPLRSLVRNAAGPYASLVNVACQEDGDFGVLEIRLTADAGFQVALRGFDLAAVADGVVIPRVEVLGDGGIVLHRRDDVLVPGFGDTALSFDFTGAPLTGARLTLRVDLSSLPNTDSHFVGIDNVSFSQARGPGCPPPPRLSISRSPSGLVLSWPTPGYRLESTGAAGGLSGAAVWTPVAGSSPVTVPTTQTAQFFRLVCP